MKDEIELSKDLKAHVKASKEKNKAIIDSYSVIEILESIGYRRIKEGKTSFFGKITNRIIEKADRADMIEDLRNEIQSMEEDFFKSNRNEISDIHKKSRALFDITSLEFLKTELIERVRDTEAESHFFYLNTVVKVTKDEIILMNYADLKGYVFAEEILQRNFSL
ncbi:hypothetical protein [Elizabethkingia anophelis]|uniref:hypothetical protein n=1 Tax=Elizabethkingia anophelis TaxID=1117645 RepID=UPI00063AD496|nr:hypothetical protein [Elizabethkingia anophelis]AKH95418.1 hypothetical protein M876_12660 [Elizabethkingia anophelis FMS-007]MCT3674368.1 hypothetical protein [Elizabethkingia anophelis]MCT3681853.1 hypothetical protein [Elizabethkingia anophelis]MCT3704324.1 hypothetical protein [Elizabethkingia anophelis]MCT3770528.1 hypothetical protein [Elizabethkingia anophelis]